MKILDRYIHNTILKTFIATILIFGLFYVFIQVVSTLDEIIDRQVPIPVLVEYYLAFLPIIAFQTAPVAALIAVMLPFSRMNNQNEIIVLRASGLSFWQITKPAIIFGLVVSSAIFLINERVVPHSQEITKRIHDDHLMLEYDRIRLKKSQIKNLTFYGRNNRLYFIDTFNPHSNELEGITIIEYDQDKNIQQKIVAFNGTWTGIAWKFYHCQITAFTTPLKIKVYKEKLMDIEETPEDFLRQRLDIGSMNIQELNDYINRFSESGANTAINSLRVDLYHKLASPLSSFVLVLIGLPFALMIKSRKGSSFLSIIIAFVVGALHFVTDSVAIAFGKGGMLAPPLAAIAAPLLFSAMAIIIIETDFAN